jgi:hydroxymethylbilane synthase
VISQLTRAAPRYRFTPVPVDTSGDRDRTPGGSTDFTDTIDRALLRGDIDLAVHSAKDLPAELGPRFRLVACPRRADPRDCLVAARAPGVRRLPRGARIGSSSPRRRAQLLRWRPDLRVVEIRGNVETRIGLVRSGNIDAAVLAVAGLLRLGRRGEISRVLPLTGFLPAPAQGALAVVTRADDADLAGIADRIDDPATHACVAAERAFAASLGGDCDVPLGALATSHGGWISLVGEILSRDGRTRLRSHRRGSQARAELVGSDLGRQMLETGAEELISSARR